MVKLRLRRQGRKGKPFYYIVAADARAPRDGRFIERIGSYNPNTNPATIDLNLDDAVRWLGNGAVPTDTCRAILSYKGALYKHHLNKGVSKGALTQDQADSKFTAWLEEKEGKITAKTEGITKSVADAVAAAHKREQEVRKAREKAIAEKNAPEDVAADAAEAASQEDVVVTTEVPANEEVADATEAPAIEEVAVEAVADEVPSAEDTSSEAPVEETENAPEEATDAAPDEEPAEAEKEETSAAEATDAPEEDNA